MISASGDYLPPPKISHSFVARYRSRSLPNPHSRWRLSVRSIAMLDHDRASPRGLDAGATVIAVGAETKDGRLNLDFLEAIRNKSTTPNSCCFVFSTVSTTKSPPCALSVEIGFHRVLTSGGPNSALQGCRQLHALSQSFARQIRFFRPEASEPVTHGRSWKQPLFSAAWIISNQS